MGEEQEDDDFDVIAGSVEPNFPTKIIPTKIA